MSASVPFAACAQDDGTDYIESAYPLNITFDKEKQQGFIIYELCYWNSSTKKSDCKDEKLLITPQTIAYANFREVPLRYVRTRRGRHAEIVYDKSSLIVKTISW